MSENERIESIRKAVASETRIGRKASALSYGFSRDALVMEGEVDSVAQKKLALKRAAGVPGVTGIVDRVRVRPAETRQDKAIRTLVADALVQEPAFADCAVSVAGAGATEVLSEPPSAIGHIHVEVEDGVVVLGGAIPSLVRKRLAGVLAWWVPGARDVVNGLAVTPAEEDQAYALAEAVEMVLEKDGFVDDSQIRVGANRGVIRLTGLVPNEKERSMAENDAWFVLGVDEVDNQIQVQGR